MGLDKPKQITCFYVRTSSGTAQAFEFNLFLRLNFFERLLVATCSTWVRSRGVSFVWIGVAGVELALFLRFDDRIQSIIHDL